mgnify:CR=1 FL=1
MKRPVLWGLVFAFAPIALPFILWPIWWLADCMPYGQTVLCTRAEWYSALAFKIVSLPWLAILTVPVGLVIAFVGGVSSGTEKREI